MPPKHAKWVIRALIAITLAAAIWLAYAKFQGLKRHLDTALHIAYKLESMASSLDIRGIDSQRVILLREDIGALEQSLRAIEGELAIPLAWCPYLGWVPRVGPDIEAAPYLLSFAIDSASAGWWALLGAESILEPLLADEDMDISALLGDALASMEGSTIYFREAEEAISRALAARSQIEGAELMPRIAGILERLDPYLPLAQMGLRGAIIVPELLGSQGERTYLLLAQNSHELRPTGGLISGIGTLSVEKGEIREISLLDSYRFDDYESNAHPPAPGPLAEYMWAGVLAIRDANWSPHFPTSAEVIAGLYQLSQKNAQIDGVIAADLEAVELVLGALGPVQPEGYDQPVSAGNVIELLQQYWSAPVGAGTIQEQKSSDWWVHRKDIMQDLLQAMLAQVQQRPADLDLRGLASAVQAALESKHILLYARDATVARDLSEFGWDGAIHGTDSDYLMVTDANLGFNKVDASVERRIHYLIRPESGRLRGEAILTYVNLSPSSAEPCRREDLYGLTEYQAESYKDLTEGCYWDYVRLYVPAGSELVHVVGLMEPVDRSWEESKSVFGTFFVVPPGQTRELRFAYYLPDRIAEQVAAGRYSLLVQKQAGTGSIPLHIEADLPADTAFDGSQQRQLRVGPTGWSYETLLETDRQIQVELRTAKIAWSTVAIALLGLALVGVGVATRKHKLSPEVE